MPYLIDLGNRGVSAQMGDHGGVRGRRGGAGFPQVEYGVRADLVATVRAAAGERSVSALTEDALVEFLARPTPAPAVSGGERARLRVRLPGPLIAEVDELAPQLGTSPRMVVEAALLRAYPHSGGVVWDPNRPQRR